MWKRVHLLNEGYVDVAEWVEKRRKEREEEAKEVVMNEAAKQPRIKLVQNGKPLGEVDSNRKGEPSTPKKPKKKVRSPGNTPEKVTKWRKTSKIAESQKENVIVPIQVTRKSARISKNVT